MLDWIVDILRSIFFFIDNIIYTFIVTLYNLLVDIAETSIFTEEVIDLFASKVYALLGIFMLFKVSFSIISYIVNPDEFLDKTKGFGKLIGNIIITLVLLIATPWIFSQAMDIQRIVLRDNILGKIFSTSEVNTQVVTDPGNTMAYETFKAFYHLNYDSHPECEGIETALTEPNSNYNRDNCMQNAFANEDNFTAYEETLQYAYATNSISIYMNSNMVNLRDSNDNYTMSYIPFISTLAGGAIALLLIVFCFDVAVRSVKLGFMRMIAPIPIVSRIDPKKGKDTFDKWLKVCISTYLDLFIRLLAIYFAVFVITQLVDLQFVDAVTGARSDVNTFVKVFIILGALLFAKQLPKLLEDLTGMKLGGGKFTLNPMKKLGEVPLAGGALAAGAVMATGGALALGRGGANLIGGGLKKGAGTALNKISGGRVGSGLMNSGNRTLGNTVSAMQRRWSRSGEEARGRFAASGFAGGEFKGDTAHAMYKKERQERAKKERQADMDITAQRNLWDLGDRSNAVSLGAGSSTADYKRAGFKSDEFIRSLQTIESNKAALDTARVAWRQAQYNFEHGVPGATAATVAAAESAFEKAQKAVSSAEENHSKFIAPRHAQDAELERARKVAKGARP